MILCITKVLSSSDHFKECSFQLITRLGGECRFDIITSSQTFLNQCKTLLLRAFQNFHSKLIYAHYRIVFTPRTHKTPFLLFMFCAFIHLGFWFVS